jgi:hypothetical protein
MALDGERHGSWVVTRGGAAGNGGTSHDLIVACTRTQATRVDPGHYCRDHFVTLSLISAIPESGKLFRVPERPDPNELTAAGPNA